MSSTISNHRVFLSFKATSESSRALQRLTLDKVHIRREKDSNIFITLNLGYAGRSELPDSLKIISDQLISVFYKELIGEVMLFSEGFESNMSMTKFIIDFEPLFRGLLSDLFPDLELEPIHHTMLSEKVIEFLQELS